MKISIVIPSYNADWLLAKGLASLATQKLDTGDAFEVVVADDGSTDATRECVAGFAAGGLDVHYVYVPRDEHSCRSRARNRGIAASSGEVLLFLDSGIVVPDRFISDIAAYYRTHAPDSALLIYTYGLNVTPEQTDMEQLERLDINDRRAVDEFCREPFWYDMRHGAFQHEIGRLRSPWFCGFSCALTAPAGLTRAIGGFDEAFKGWGVEDLDFSYRLHRNGVCFDSVSSLYAFHYPHPIQYSAEKPLNEQRNKENMHAKYYELETELFAFERHEFPHVLAKLDYLQLADLLPADYRQADLDELSERCLDGAERSLLVGVDDVKLAGRLPVTHLFGRSPGMVEKLQAAFPEREVAYLLGYATPYENDFFDVAIVSDLLRALNPQARRRLLEEMNRIAREVIVLIGAALSPRIDQELNARVIPGQSFVGSPFQPYAAMEKVFSASREEMAAAAVGLERVRLVDMALEAALVKD
ncbi:glycosyltransferase [Paenibacillus athensensis]|uniref:glycosyltransferase n=1 Tax=Paenibacillus athensensis TaxID=1967502 RepID=UPI00142FBD95|nr:glycosyltransferase [Paenibacillus athensensis]MCD1258033.1 glycosyltransferase [Paenibacillus athensensis]